MDPTGAMDPSVSKEAAWLRLRALVLFHLQEAWREPLGRIRLIDTFARHIIASKPLLTQTLEQMVSQPEIKNGIRVKFVKELEIGPPKNFRMIDCRCTIEQKQVVLIDWHSSRVPYSAVSHTFGMDVYAVFDCECASKCDAQAPRCSPKCCPGHSHFPGHGGSTHAKIISDILNMCVRLRAAGAEYVWHDGVCIAQHNEVEVHDTIQHMGWIYGHAKETFIFLHYVGNPVAPIRHDGDLISRWVTRAWTLQEAALSPRRRYCLRRCSDLHHCQNLKQFEAEIARWYEDDSTIAVVEEDEYLTFLIELIVVLGRLIGQEMLQIKDPVRFLFKCWQRIRSANSHRHMAGTTIPTLFSLFTLMSMMRDAENQIRPSLGLLDKSYEWLNHLTHLICTCADTCCMLPTIEAALSLSSLRDSKHEGDRINSILALAGVSDFVAPKDGNMASSTIEFFKRQGQDGLGRAVFSVNLQGAAGGSTEEDSWVPCLSRQLQPIRTDAARSMHRLLRSIDVPADHRIMKSIVDSAKYISYKVLQNGRIQLIGNLAGLSVELTFRSGRIRKSRRARRSTNYENSEVNIMRMDIYVKELGGFVAYREEAEMGKAAMSVHNYRPYIKGQLVEDGESFRAHLVYPVAALRYKANKANKLYYLNPPELFEVCSCVPSLIIQGDLEAEEAVSKIGHFYVLPALQKFLLANNRTSSAMITRLNRLVLK